MIQIGTAKAYNVQESAMLLNVSAQTIRTYINIGKLKAQKSGRAYYIEETTLQAFIKGDYKKDDSKVYTG